MNKDVVPKDFSISLAIVDALPTIFFCISMLLVYSIFNSSLFLLGSLLMLFAGLSKVLWKVIVVKCQKNIWFLFVQMRITMPIGLLLVIVSLIVNYEAVNVKEIINVMSIMPQVMFFIIGIIGMLLMLIFAFKLDGSKAKNNWIEQITNCIAQASFMLGIMMIVSK